MFNAISLGVIIIELLLTIVTLAVLQLHLLVA